MTFKEALTKALIDQMGFYEGDPILLEMAEPVVEFVGEVDNPEKLATTIVAQIIMDNVPHEFCKGTEKVRMYFSTYIIEFWQAEILESAQKCMTVASE